MVIVNEGKNWVRDMLGNKQPNTPMDVFWWGTSQQSASVTDTAMISPWFGFFGSFTARVSNTYSWVYEITSYTGAVFTAGLVEMGVAYRLGADPQTPLFNRQVFTDPNFTTGITYYIQLQTEVRH